MMNYAHENLLDLKLEVRHFKLLAAVVDTGTVTAAAQRLHLTQSALSHQLRDAEERLGTPLFLRVKKRMVLTPAGRKLLESARRALAELKRTEDEIEEERSGAAGTLRISTECYTCYHWLPGVLRQFHLSHPRVDVSIDVASTSKAVPALLDAKIDLAIVSSNPEGPNLLLQPLFEDEMFVVISRTHRLASKAHLRPQDLVAETLLVYPPREESLLLQRILAPAGVEPSSVLEVPLTEAILEMVKAEIGVAFMAGWAIAPAMKAKAVVARRITARGFHRHWCAATLRDRKLPPYVDALVRLLADRSKLGLTPSA